MFTWSYQARIELLPDFSSIVGIAITHFLASQRKLLPDWAPEDHPIQLQSSESEFIAVQTWWNEGPFRKKFYATVRIIFRRLHVLIHISIQVAAVGAHFLEHAFKTAQYLVVDHPELNPPWRGILCSWDHHDGIEVHTAQVLVRWDPRYGFPLLHNYMFTSDTIVVCYSFFFHDYIILYLDWQVGWFEGVDIFDFIVHTIGRTTSPGCIMTQEYREQGDLSIWRPMIPDNAFLATLISLVSFHISN